MNPTYHGSNYLPYQPPPPPPQPPLPAATNSTSIVTTTNQSTYPTTSYQYYNNALPSISDTGSTHGISQEPTLADYNAYQGYDGYYDYYEGYGEEEYYEDDGKQKHYHCEICNVMCSGYDNYFAHLCKFF